jgi:hypothetical protein
MWYVDTIELIEGASRSRGDREDAAKVGCIISYVSSSDDANKRCLEKPIRVSIPTERDQSG